MFQAGFTQQENRQQTAQDQSKPASVSFSKGPMSSRWLWMWRLMCDVHSAHWWSLRRSCTVDSRRTVVQGLQRGSPGSRLLGMPRIWRSRSATCQHQRNFVGRSAFFISFHGQLPVSSDRNSYQKRLQGVSIAFTIPPDT